MLDLVKNPMPANDIHAGLRIQEVRTAIVDVPTVRAHKLSSLTTSRQNYVLVRI